MNIKVVILIISGMVMVGCGAKTEKPASAEQINKKIETLKREKDSLMLQRQKLAEEEFKRKKNDDLKFALDQEILSKDVKINEQVLQKSELQLDKKKYQTKVVIIGIVTVTIIGIVTVVLMITTIPKKKTTKSGGFFHQLFLEKEAVFLDFSHQNNTINFREI